MSRICEDIQKLFLKNIKEEIGIFNNIGSIFNKIDKDNLFASLFTELNNIFSKEKKFAFKGRLIRTVQKLWLLQERTSFNDPNQPLHLQGEPKGHSFILSGSDVEPSHQRGPPAKVQSPARLAML